MPAKEEFEKLWPHAIVPPNYKQLLWTWFRNGWDAACEDAAQHVAEADSADGSHLIRVLGDDEVVGRGVSFHMERMDDDHIWFQVDGISFDLGIKRGKLIWEPQSHGGWAAIVRDGRAA